MTCKVDAIVERGQAADRQWRRVIWAGCGGTVAGIVLMAVLPGAIARSLPISWHAPEWMATRVMRMDRAQAGARLQGVESVAQTHSPLAMATAASDAPKNHPRHRR